MESSVNPSHGRAQSRGATLGIGEGLRFGLREKPVAAVPASTGESETVAGTIEVIAPEPASVSVIEMVADKSATVDTIEVATVEPTSVAKRRRPRARWSQPRRRSR